LGLAASPPAAAGPERLPAAPGGPVVEVVDGDTLLLDDRTEVRLVGLQAPKLPLDRPNFRKWPLADEAKAALERLGLGKSVELRFGGRRTDRHGRTLAHLLRADGLWLQGEMLRQGMARVYSFDDNRALVADMLALEGEARAAGRGIWAHPYYRVRAPDETNRDVDTFQLVEGRVLAVARVGGRLYLNYGRDWKEDFTVIAERRAVRLLESEGFDWRRLEGRTIRVRGWVMWQNGPAIQLTHPEQIERLEDG